MTEEDNIDWEELKKVEQSDFISPDEEAYLEWKTEHYSSLEEGFIQVTPPEDQPLDDDTEDFFMTYENEFDDYCKEQYELWKYD